MPQVKLNIAGREYQVNCADGEEQRLEALGGLIDDKLREGAEPSALSETRALGSARCFWRTKSTICAGSRPTAMTSVRPWRSKIWPGRSKVLHRALRTRRRTPK